MLHFGNKSDSCKSCIPFKGFRLISVIIIGGIIGFFATSFVIPPPSIKLLLETKHDRDTTTILKKLYIIEQDVLIIKKDILNMKQRASIEGK